MNHTSFSLFLNRVLSAFLALVIFMAATPAAIAHGGPTLIRYTEI